MDNSSENLDKGKSISHQIDEQKKLEGEIKQNITPLSVPIVAESHTPVYNMHRYFARRPSNVFEAIITHYTNPGDIVLDPFMGGGVTVVESLRSRRKVVGVDLNPMAWYIVDNEVRNIKLQTVSKLFKKVEKEVKPQINKLYEVTCDTCGKLALGKESLWSKVVRCPNLNCSNPVVLNDAKKVSGGRYECPICNIVFEVIKSERLGEKLINVDYCCPHCGVSSGKTPTDKDLERYKHAIDELETMTTIGQLSYPEDMIPDGDRVRDDALYKKGYTHFYTLFTRRNLLANALLKKTILASDADTDARKALIFAFSSSLSWTNRMRQEKGGWGYHGYWLPEISYESNVWDMFKKQFDGGVHSFWKGKTYSNKEFGNFALPAKDFNALANI
jgi:Adenine-specific DNA methylase containing a Zn-ribbon